MTNEEFVKWLSGFFELADDASLTRKQLYVISNHLNLAEAVEGALGPFNKEIREMVKGQIDVLENPEDVADPEFCSSLKAKVLAGPGF